MLIVLELNYYNYCMLFLGRTTLCKTLISSFPLNTNLFCIFHSLFCFPSFWVIFH
uniref:Uncharacterized protein n=1 Tax=Rhizophora mucronata TaxID=61149 RepID=A0A2P2QGK2_RHIMU